MADVVAHYTRVAESGAWPRHAHRLGAGQWEYNRELLREALATRPEQRARFLTWLETNHAIYEDVGAHRSGGRPGGADKHLLRHIIYYLLYYLYYCIIHYIILFIVQTAGALGISLAGVPAGSENATT